MEGRPFIVSGVQRLGPYRIIRTIAIGGMGEVFLATLERSGGFEKRVALKCVLPRLMADPHFVELFEREARLAAALSHRHIVQIFDFGRAEGRSWLAMEYVHGVDLKAVLDGVDGPVPLGLAVEIGVACARGLDYAHRSRDSRGRPLHLIHRDVSPQNVLLSFEGDVKLADFGLAHAAARDPHEGGLQGKFAYMSPEQVEGRPLDGRSDQFALGVVLYELVSGQRAFFADDGVELILDRVRRAAPLRPLGEAAPALPAPIRQVIERALRADRTERFPDAGSLAEALSGAATASGLHPGEPALGPWLRSRFPERSRPPRIAAEFTASAARPASAPVEVTAAAGQPISRPEELTVDAAAPVGLRIDPLAATPSGEGPDVDRRAGPPARHTAVIAVPEDDDPVAAGHGPSTAPPTDGRSGARRPSWILIALVLGGGAIALAFGLTSNNDPSVSNIIDSGHSRDGIAAARAPGATPVDATPVDAAPPDGTPPVNAAPVDAAPIDAAPDAARPDRSVDARSATPARPRPATARVARPRDAAPPPTLRPPIDRGPPPPDAAPAPVDSPDAAPAPEPPRGPRIRAFSPGARIQGPGADEGGWAVPEAGLLLRAVDGPGPPVILRIRARGGRFEAAVDARPWGQVWLGDRDLGATPAAAVPLEVGRQTLRVIGPDGGETVVRIEAIRD